MMGFRNLSFSAFVSVCLWIEACTALSLSGSSGLGSFNLEAQEAKLPEEANTNFEAPAGALNAVEMEPRISNLMECHGLQGNTTADVLKQQMKEQVLRLNNALTSLSQEASRRTSAASAAQAKSGQTARNYDGEISSIKQRLDNIKTGASSETEEKMSNLKEGMGYVEKAALAISESDESTCPKHLGYQNLSPQGPCIKVHDNTLDSWNVAKLTCQDETRFSRLYRPKSQSDFNYMKQMLYKRYRRNSYTSCFWIGGETVDASQPNHKRQFRWLDNTAVPRYFWGPREPNNSGNHENCLDLIVQHRFRGNDEPCERLCPFICEFIKGK